MISLTRKSRSSSRAGGISDKRQITDSHRVYGKQGLNVTRTMLFIEEERMGYADDERDFEGVV